MSSSISSESNMMETPNKKKLPNSDAYEKVKLYISDDGFKFDVNEQPTIQQFERAIGEDITLMGICLLNTVDNFPLKLKNGEPCKNIREYYESDNPSYDGKKIDYMQKEQDWQTKGDEWLYMIAYNDHIVKIGMTENTLKERFESYNCGTEKAMKKGSCSTTNYIISECNFLAIELGMDVKIYGIKCPIEYTEITRFGMTKFAELQLFVVLKPC